MENEANSYQDILGDIRSIINSGRNSANAAANSIGIMTYWNIGTQYYDRLLKSPQKAVFYAQHPEWEQ